VAVDHRAEQVAVGRVESTLLDDDVLERSVLGDRPGDNRGDLCVAGDEIGLEGEDAEEGVVVGGPRHRGWLQRPSWKVVALGGDCRTRGGPPSSLETSLSAIASRLGHCVFDRVRDDLLVGVGQAVVAELVMCSVRSGEPPQPLPA
jgi:hypothetical protein